MPYNYNDPMSEMTDESNEADKKIVLNEPLLMSLPKTTILIEDFREVNERGQYTHFDPAGSDTTVEESSISETSSTEITSDVDSEVVCEVEEDQMDLDADNFQEKLIVTLKLLSPYDKVPLVLMYQFGRNVVQLKHVLKVLDEKKFITLDLEAGTLDINGKFLQEHESTLSKMDQLAASRETLTTLKSVVSIGWEAVSVLEAALPHVLHAWQAVLDEQFLVHEFIQLPFHIINTYQRLGYDEKRFAFGKETLKYFKSVDGLISTFRMLRLEFHVASAAIRVGDNATSYRILKDLAPRAKNWDKDHWLTNEIFQDYAQALLKRKMYEEAYKYQLVACEYYSREKGDTIKTALAFFRKAKILYKLEKTVQARDHFLTVLEFGKMNRLPNLIKDARVWIRNCGLLAQAKEMIQIAESQLEDCPGLINAKRLVLLTKKLGIVLNEFPSDSA